MTPRWPLFVLFAAAGTVLVFPPVAAPFVDLSPATSRFVNSLGVSLNFLVLGLALVDLVISPSLRRIEVQREMSDVMSVGARNAVRVWLTNRNRSAVTVEFQDEPPQPCATDGLPFISSLAPLKARYRVYYVEPHHRGPTAFGDIYLRARSRLGCWTFYDQRPVNVPVRVYPDIQAVHGIELLARRNRLAETGLKLSRLRGRGTEFDRLREYRREDEFRHIDWKATARQRQVISREYVVLLSEPVWLRTLADWNRTVAALVMAPALPSTGPAMQPSRFSRVWASLSWDTVIASAGNVAPRATTVTVAAAMTSLERIRMRLTPLVASAESAPAAPVQLGRPSAPKG
jgi:hypothetical protein